MIVPHTEHGNAGFSLVTRVLQVVFITKTILRSFTASSQKGQFLKHGVGYCLTTMYVMINYSFIFVNAFNTLLIDYMLIHINSLQDI